MSLRNLFSPQGAQPAQPSAPKSQLRQKLEQLVEVMLAQMPGEVRALLPPSLLNKFVRDVMNKQSDADLIKGIRVASKMIRELEESIPVSAREGD